MDQSQEKTALAGNIASELGFEGKHAWQAYELEYALLTEVGCPENLYKALVIARQKGIIADDFDWSRGKIVYQNGVYFKDFEGSENFDFSQLD